MRIGGSLGLCFLFSIVSLASKNENLEIVPKPRLQYGLAFHGVNAYCFRFDELQKIPYLLNLPRKGMITWPGIKLMVGNRKTYFLSIDYSLGLTQLSRGSFENHEQVKVSCSTNLINLSAHRNLILRNRINLDLDCGVSFANTILTSINELYYTAPKDTIQYFFSGKLKQNWIFTISSSILFPVRGKESRNANVSVGLSAGYNLGLTKGVIIQTEGAVISSDTTFDYSGPFVSIVVLNVWSTNKSK